jgi:hypothetical protein
VSARPVASFGSASPADSSPTPPLS